MGFFSWLLGGAKKEEPAANLLGAGTYTFDIVGESNYQRALKKFVVGGRKKATRKSFRLL